MAATRTFGFVRWECERCHREVMVEDVVVQIVRIHFDLRCPICEQLVRFVVPSVRALDNLPPDETMPISRAAPPGPKEPGFEVH